MGLSMRILGLGMRILGLGMRLVHTLCCSDVVSSGTVVLTAQWSEGLYRSHLERGRKVERGKCDSMLVWSHSNIVFSV